jgi:hydrogenase nickel incorporation protein HypB
MVRKKQMEDDIQRNGMNSHIGEDIVVIRAEEQIMGTNADYAEKVRRILREKQIYCINLISSPGSGKTTLLVKTLNNISKEISCAVIEGDQQTINDARRISETGVPVVQVNTLQSCHLNANQILESLRKFPLENIQLMIIENVGNLVCPASMDLGENEKIVLMSVTEGEDKPVKYPLAFNLAKVLVITKTDLLPYLRFDLESCKQYARSVNEHIQIIETSSFSQTGIPEWITYLKKRVYDLGK